MTQQKRPNCRGQGASHFFICLYPPIPYGAALQQIHQQYGGQRLWRFGGAAERNDRLC
ncbi:hypothetical protein NDI52_32405 [Leptolyngbya sp. PL-A3]|uniref:hypothetical protein n=1 Tax=Leptolyngbya sp. PL-A3 TaxID=2933911 RepID=UPI0032991E57